VENLRIAGSLPEALEGMTEELFLDDLAAGNFQAELTPMERAGCGFDLWSNSSPVNVK
jgi:hypothetical protein